MIEELFGMIRSVGIEWPTDQPILSAKDQLYPKVEDAENNFDAEVII